MIKDLLSDKSCAPAATISKVVIDADQIDPMSPAGGEASGSDRIEITAVSVANESKQSYTGAVLPFVVHLFPN